MTNSVYLKRGIIARQLL